MESQVFQMGELTPEAEGRYYSPKMQWWCVHAHMTDASKKDWSFYFWPALGSIDEAWIATLFTSDQVIDFTQVHLPLGSLHASREGVDVSYGPNFIRGSYPSYKIHVEGNRGDPAYMVDLQLTAESDSFRAVRDTRGIDWNYIPRLRVTGTIGIAGRSVPVEGHGYYERRRGRFWTPGVKMGLWESIPLASQDGLSIPLFYKVWRDDDSAQVLTLTFTVDGKRLVEFKDVNVDILEATRFEGFTEVAYPMRFRVSASDAEGKADLLITRSPHRLKMRNYFEEPDRSANAVGMYGPGKVQGTLQYKGRSYTVDADSFGSGLFFTRKNVPAKA